MSKPVRDASHDASATLAFANAQAAWLEVFEQWLALNMDIASEAAAALRIDLEGRAMTARMRRLFTAGARAQQLSVVAWAAAFGGPAEVALGGEFVPGGLDPAPAGKGPNGFQALSRPLGRPDDLTRIKGLGAAMQDKLNAIGVFHFWQLASLSSPAADALDARLGANGRIAREDWLTQARKLSEDVAA